MGDQPWLNSVRERLARYGLPPSYVQRFTEELGDHLEDLNEEGPQADAASRLGEPTQVASAAVAAYRRRTFVGRHPAAAFLVFAISPVVLWQFLFYASMFLRAVFGGCTTVHFHEDHWMLSLMALVCSTFAGCLYAELAIWLGVGRKWTFVSCAVLGAVATLFEFGLGLVGGVTMMAPVQLAAPLAVGWRFGKWKSSYRYPATTVLVFVVSPVASHLLLFMIVALAIVAAQPLFSSPSEPVNAHFALVALAGLLTLLLIVLPTFVTSLLYCKLVAWFGIDRRWMWVSCTMLTVYTATLFFRQARYAVQRDDFLTAGLVACMILGHALVPLAVAWWFMRRKHGRDNLEFTS